jgi:hypothetical protein
VGFVRLRGCHFALRAAADGSPLRRDLIVSVTPSFGWLAEPKLTLLRQVA